MIKRKTPRIVQMSSIITISTVKKRALYFGSLREWKPTQVSKAFLDRYAAQCDALLKSMVESHPSKGKTLL